MDITLKPSTYAEVIDQLLTMRQFLVKDENHLLNLITGCEVVYKTGKVHSYQGSHEEELFKIKWPGDDTGHLLNIDYANRFLKTMRAQTASLHD